MNNRFLRNGLVTLILVVGTAALLYMFIFPTDGKEPIDYSGPNSFLSLVADGQVSKVTQRGQLLDIELTTTDPATGKAETQTSNVPNELATDVQADITAACSASPKCTTTPKLAGAAPSDSGAWLSILISAFLPILLIGALLFFMFRQAQGSNNQALSFGKSRARMFLGNKTVVTFQDVAGVDEAKTELQEVVEFLKYPEKFNQLGARIPRGVLLVGPPGTGKTLLARAVAGEAGVPFFSISGSEFVEMFVGVGASRVRDLFDQAKRNSPCIVFVDEIDAVGRQRGAGLGGSHDEREQTLNQILVEMDGFDTNTNVIVVAATNRPDVLDPALLRPGRFDRQVILDRPDMKGRLEILKVHIKGKPLDKQVDLTTVARQSPGFSGADLANLVNEAAILAARRNKKVISLPEFTEALERVVAGPERKSRVISDAEKAIIAYHEGGHAVVQRVLPKTDPVSKVSIISRGMALGYTMGMPQEDRYLQSKSEFEDKIAGMLGGNASEKLIFGDTTTGSSNDIEKATTLARRMVTEFGMSEKLGPLSFGKRDELVFLGREIGEQRNYSDDVAKTIDDEVRVIIDRAYAKAMDVLTQHKGRLVQLAERLVAEETIEQEEFEKMFSDLPDPRKDTHVTPQPLDGPMTPRPVAEKAAPATAPKPSPQPA
ncbi:MAG TPA: ATP-dependent zinc metalloprotease FtsH [Candidatus Limnocylindria bacterium]|nr:ATP-dependent zinc metalloprotease FtsH [Candidatus Limnocylindria bacterium]